MKVSKGEEVHKAESGEFLARASSRPLPGAVGTGLPFQVMCDKREALPTRAVHPSLRVQSFSRMLSHGHH